MIAKHDTLTCLNPKYWIFNLVKFLWKCQYDDIALDHLYDYYLDIRVRYDKHSNKWVACHGYVDLQKTFNTFGDVIVFIHNTSKRGGRIFIERGKYPVNEVKEAIDELCPIYPSAIHYITTKQGELIYTSNKRWPRMITKYHQYKKDDETIWQAIKRFFKERMTIKKFADKTPIKDNFGQIYFHDYVK